MESISIVNSKILFRGVERDILSVEIVDDLSFSVSTNLGVINFVLNDVEINGEIKTMDEVLSVIPQQVLNETIAKEKERLIKRTDEQTQQEIYNGFTFDGKTFSMSVNAQINWSNFPNLPTAVFPLTIMTKNDEEYVLQESDKTTFYMAALSYKNSKLQTGNVKKKLIQACTTINELKLI